jgi:hypothetical protein
MLTAAAVRNTTLKDAKDIVAGDILIRRGKEQTVDSCRVGEVYVWIDFSDGDHLYCYHDTKVLVKNAS